MNTVTTPLALFDSHVVRTIPQSRPRLIGASTPTTLSELIDAFEVSASLHGPDVDVPACDLTMSEDGSIVVPGHGAFALTAWAKKQLASRVGIQWDRWFDGIDAKLRADEVNRRFARSEGVARVKTARTSEDGPFLRGFVSTSYSTVPDAVIARSILDALGKSARIVRCTSTDRTTSYVVQVGAPLRFGGPVNVGDVVGGLLVRNSDVGYASLVVSLHLTRLVCLNGMVVNEQKSIIRRPHRHIDVEVLNEQLAGGLTDLPSRIQRAGRLLERSGHHSVDNIERALVDVLRAAHLPQRLLPVMLGAYGREPSATVFGISQAITLGAQHVTISSEDRLSLEQAAGLYLQRFAGS